MGKRKKRKGNSEKKKHNVESRIKTYSIKLIFDFIRDNPNAEFYIDEDGNKCKLRRAKYYYEIGIQCVDCSVTAQFFALEKWFDESFHFDLYGIDSVGDEVLITIDHILARFNGGKDHVSNYQTMCTICNARKSNIFVKERIVYCGMADDILSPILLVPTFAVLFVIDKFDMAFAREHSWEEQKKDIKQMLTEGHDEFSWHREVYLEYKKTWPITKLDAKCEILSEEDKDGRWHLVFKYQGIKRELIYFHHRDFVSVWPEEINNIKHVMSMGATFPIHEPELKQMLEERTVKECMYYELYNQFFHENMPGIFTINVRESDILIRDLKPFMEVEYKVACG
jgi:hypothetical protein